MTKTKKNFLNDMVISACMLKGKEKNLGTFSFSTHISVEKE